MVEIVVDIKTPVGVANGATGELDDSMVAHAYNFVCRVTTTVLVYTAIAQ